MEPRIGKVIWTDALALFGAAGAAGFPVVILVLSVTQPGAKDHALPILGVTLLLALLAASVVGWRIARVFPSPFGHRSTTRPGCPCHRRPNLGQARQSSRTFTCEGPSTAFDPHKRVPVRFGWPLPGPGGGQPPSRIGLDSPGSKRRPRNGNVTHGCEVEETSAGPLG